MADAAKARIAAVACLAAVAPAWSATLDFQQAVDTALRQNPDLRAVQAQIAQADAGVRQARDARWPKVVATVGAARSNDPLNVFGMKLQQRNATFNDFGAGEFAAAMAQGSSALPAALATAPANLNQPDAYDNVNTRLEADLPLYTGGKLTAYRAQAEAMLKAAQAGDRAARQQVIAHVLQAYQGVYTARAFKAVAAQALQAAQGEVRMVQNLYDQGVVVRSDLLSAQVRLGEVELEQRRAADMEAQAMDALHVILGLPMSESIELGPDVSLSLPAGAPDAWVDQAVAANPQIQALQQQVDAAGGRVQAARADLYPQIGAMARVDTNDRHFGMAAHSYTVGAQLTWTVFDAGVTRGAIDQAAAAQSEQRERLRSAQDQLRMQLRQSWRDEVAAEDEARTRALAVRQAEEAVRIVDQRYANGAGTLVELQGTQAQLDKARADLVLARGRIDTARAALRLALGQLSAADARPIAGDPTPAAATLAAAPSH